MEISKTSRACRRAASGFCLMQLAALGVGAWPAAAAQAYPVKSITLVVPFPPGAATDVFARAAGRRMGELLGQTIVILNRDGASGAIGTEMVAKAAGDGYTLLWGSSGPLAISPVWTEKLPYDPLRDFAPVSLFAKIPYLLIVHPAVPAKNVKELVALARAHPGKLNFASSGSGGTAHLAGELFKSMAKIDIVHVPYRGTSLFATELIAGQVDLAFAGPTTALPHLTTFGGTNYSLVSGTFALNADSTWLYSSVEVLSGTNGQTIGSSPANYTGKWTVTDSTINILTKYGFIRFKGDTLFWKGGPRHSWEDSLTFTLVRK